MEEPHPDIDNIGSLDKYPSVMVKLEYETNSGGNIDTVKLRAADENGFAIGWAHNNPLLDTREYEVELEDGTTHKYLTMSLQRMRILNYMARDTKLWSWVKL